MVAITRALAFAALGASVVVAAPGNATTLNANALAAKSGFVSCPTAPANPQDRRKDTSKLKYATFNTELMFLQAFGTLRCPGSDCKWATVADAKLHIKQIASIIHSLDADIIHLNEVGDCTVLKTLVANLAALGDSTYKPYLVRSADTSTGENPALLTRIDPTSNLQRSTNSQSLPVDSSTCPDGANYPASKSVSKNFVTTFRVPGFSQDLTVIGAHLLAEPTNTQRCFEREGQAQVLADLAQHAVNSGNHVIVSGDMNDWSNVAIDRNNNAPISNALGIMEGNNFQNVGGLANQADRYSQWWDRNNDCVYDLREVSSLDHILVSPSLANSIADVAFRHDLDRASCSGFNSDHYPVTVTLTPA